MVDGWAERLVVSLVDYLVMLLVCYWAVHLVERLGLKMADYLV